MGMDISFNKREAILAGVITCHESRELEYGHYEDDPKEGKQYRIECIAEWMFNGQAIRQDCDGINNPSGDICVQYLRNNGRGAELKRQLDAAGVASEVW